MAPEFRARVRFPRDIAARRGRRSLIQDPQVTVGTIHSVKGSQAAVVYLFPDLSRAGDATRARTTRSADGWHPASEVRVRSRDAEKWLRCSFAVQIVCS